MRLLATLHDPWMALCFAHALGDELGGVATYGGEDWAERFAQVGVPAVLAPPADDATTMGLLDDPAVAAFVRDSPSLLLCFKPSRRLEERADALGARLASAPASVAQRLENKLTLRSLAAEGGILVTPEPLDPVGLPAQVKVTVTPELSMSELRSAVGASAGETIVVQSPRGFMGRKTWGVHDEPSWSPVRAQLDRRPAKVTRFVHGRPGTLNAVVDAAGTVLCTAPIVQVTGEEHLTPYPLGSCGNDFTWRPQPHPATGPYQLAARLGPALAAAGFVGHFGIDFVVEDRGDQPARTWLIEINPRLTASMALYSAWRPILVRAHLSVLDGSELRSTGQLPPLLGGQLLMHNITDGPVAPLNAHEAGVPLGGAAMPRETRLWPQVTSFVAPGGTRGRLVREGAVVGDDGTLLVT